MICLQDATKKSQKAFVHVASEIGAYEAEEIGVYSLPSNVFCDLPHSDLNVVNLK